MDIIVDLVFGFIYFGYLALLSIGTSVIIWEKL